MSVGTGLEARSTAAHPPGAHIPYRRGCPDEAFDPQTYKLRNRIERMFCRLKVWRRIATRYSNLAANFAAAVTLAAIVIWWL